MTMTVDEFVRREVPPEHQETFAILRATVLECAPHAEELVSYNMPVFKASGKLFAWILATKKDVTFSFREGIQFDDRFGVLKGTGKHARHIKIKSPNAVDKDVLRYYIRQALQLDALAPTGADP